MPPVAIVLSLALSLVAAPGALAPFSSGQAELQEIERARPDGLSVNMQQAERGHFALTARFRALASGAPGELRIDLWNEVEHPIVEVNFSVLGVSHVYVRQVEAEEEHQVWLSPIIEAELAHDTPDIILLFWAVLTDPRIRTQVGGWLSMLPPDPLAKNPACGVTKWGLKALIWIAGAACCGGGFGAACAACAVGGGTALDAIDGIDCNKECKPDCPIP